jgi:hypothetical protein
LSELFSDKSNLSSTRSSKNKKKKISVGKQFQLALTELVNAITSTEVHYIRCLKSNIAQDPNHFDIQYVERQMMQAGLPNAGEILVAGYPHKFSHYDFYKENINIVPSLNGRNEQYKNNPKEFCTAFVNHVKNATSNINQKEPDFPKFNGTIVGKSLVLLGIHEYKAYVQFRASRRAIISIQAAYRGHGMRVRKSLDGSKGGSVNIRKRVRLRKQSKVVRYDSMKDLLI